jgi:hypothetical protein
VNGTRQPTVASHGHICETDKAAFLPDGLADAGVYGTRQPTIAGHGHIQLFGRLLLAHLQIFKMLPNSKINEHLRNTSDKKGKRIENLMS